MLNHAERKFKLARFGLLIRLISFLTSATFDKCKQDIVHW